MMKSLKTYEDWKYCITELCKMPLTVDVVEQRLAELKDAGNFGTQKFLSSWGETHLRQVIAWFEQARIELTGKAGS